jgi:beta-lactam-binding protein with PASTA domain
LLSTVVYAPAKPGKLPGIVVGQSPAQGTLSAYQKVRLVVSRAVYGVVPKLVGLKVSTAREELAHMKLRPALDGGVSGRVVAQAPRPGYAAKPGMRVVLTVRRS